MRRGKLIWVVMVVASCFATSCSRQAKDVAPAKNETSKHVGADETATEASNPWSDPSIKVDHAAELEVYRELLDTKARTYAVVREKWKVGVETTAAEAFARLEYFAAVAQIEWLKDDFEESYRATVFAAHAAEDNVISSNALYQGGKIMLETLSEGQLRRAKVKLVLLRYQAEAKRRGISLPVVTQEMAEEEVRRRFDRTLEDK